MAKITKTNGMRILDRMKIDYEISSYEVNDGKIDGISVAKKIKRSCEEVFKTLVTIGSSNEHYVFLIPVDKELDLKKCAKLVGEKKIEMIAVNDIQKITGYIRGGCSPLGMKKKFKTFIDESAVNQEEIVFSAGKIGAQIIVKKDIVLSELGFNSGDLIK